MCPVCITTAVLIAGSAASTGGLAAVAKKKSWVSRLRDELRHQRQILCRFWKEVTGGLHDRYHW